MPAAPADRAALERLVGDYCAAWSEPDPARRREILSRAWADDGAYTDPTVHAAGREELVAHIGRALAQYPPGARVERTSSVDAHHGVLRFAWHMVLPDGTALPEGIDFGELAPDGRLSRIVGFFGALRPAR